MITTLHVDTKTSKRAKVLLQPFLQLYSYGELSITGTVDEKYAKAMMDRIASRTPGIQSVFSRIDDYMTQAEEAYVQGLYCLAYHKWNHVTEYCGYMFHNTYFEYAEWKTLKDKIHPSSSAVLGARLGAVKVYLRTGNYTAALAGCHFVLTTVSHRHRFAAQQFLLCAWIAYFWGHEHDATWIFGMHKEVAEDLPYREDFDPY